MIKTFLRITVAVMLVAACKKEEPAPEPTPPPDTTRPTLTMKGNSSDTISLGTTYTDPGVTATDDVDGDITSRVTVTGTVDNTRVGGNYIYYNVKDAAGNSTQVNRYVYVRNGAYRMVGTYNVVSNCGANFTGLTSTAMVETSTSVNNKITISNQQFQSPGFYVSAVINGTSITMYTQAIASSLASGTGTVSADMKSFTLTTTYTPAIQGSSGCNIVYTRQ
jgi:trimeric autotransporter adhesin